MIVSAIQTEEEFCSLENEWNCLLRNSASDTVFLTWEWMRTWWKYYGTGKSLFIITVRGEAGRLLGLAPLCIKNTGFHGLATLKALSFLGSGEVCADYLDFIAEAGKEREVLKAIFDSLNAGSRLWDYVLLSDIPEKSETLDIILNGVGSSHFIAGVNECPFIDLPDNYGSYLEGLGSNTRYNLSRRTRAIYRKFDAEFSACDGDGVENQMESLFELHRKRREMIGKEGSFLSEKLSAFHREVSRTFSKIGVLKIYRLLIGGKPAAMLYGFKYGGKFFYYQSGMDPQYEKESVGTALMGHCIRDSIESGLKEFDFLRGNEAYKHRWTGTSRKTVDIVLRPERLKGRALMSAESLIVRAKRLVKMSVAPRGSKGSGKKAL